MKTNRRIIKWNLNQGHVRRAEFLGIEPQEGRKIQYFTAGVNQIKALLEEKFLDPEESQNSAPFAKEFYAFLQDHPVFLAHGYVVNHPRKDYQVAIEGLEGESFSSEDADEFSLTENEAYSWWD